MTSGGAATGRAAATERLNVASSPVIAEHDVTVYLGDVREQLALLPAGSVQCAVTSPPYYALRDYGVEGQRGLEASPAEYVAAMVEDFRAVKQVLADDGVLWLNLGDSYSGSWGNQSHEPDRMDLHVGLRSRDALPMGTRIGSRRPGAPGPKNLYGIPWRVAFALQDDGWILRNAVIWHKPNAMPESVTDRLSTRYEHLFLFSKSRRYTFDLDAIREPLLHPAAADGTRVFGGKQGGAGKVGSSFRTAGGMPNVYGKAQNLTPRHAVATDNTGWKQHEPEPHAAGRNPGDVWTIPTSPFPGAHFACMPPELARRCILAGCPTDGTVLDPFAGSGTTLKVARSLGRKSVGIELNPDYIDIIRDRIGPTPFDFGGVS